jgi:PBSX family phage terminase large subunit
MSEKPALSDKQITVLRNATQRWNILYGATRSGKTHVSYFLALKHIKEHYNDNILFAGKTLNTIDRNVFDPMRELFGKEHVGNIIEKREIEIFGKRCYVVGANDDRAITKIQGLGLGYAYLDELTTFPENFFQMLKSRLDAPNACCDATCNPESPSHFVKQFIDKPDIGCYAEHFTLYDNPYLTDDFVSALENEYRGTIYFDKWILGNWVKAEGLVFPLFNRKKHFLTPDEYARKFGRNRLRYVIFGCDGANINDATAIVPLAIMSNGQAVTLEMFYHNPKLNGQLSNEQLMPFIQQYLNELNAKYRLIESGAEFYTCVDAAAADLRLVLSYHLPEWYNVRPYTKKNLFQTTDTVNNAFARGVLRILDFGGHYNYWRKSFESGVSQLVVDLELMTWDKTNEHFDNKIPNDCADAFRYAVCTYFENPENIWETPNTNDRFKEMEEEK